MASDARYYVTVGDLAVSEDGKIGRVETFKHLPGGDTIAVGKSFEGQPWEAEVPLEINRMVALRLQKRIEREVCESRCNCE